MNNNFTEGALVIATIALSFSSGYLLMRLKKVEDELEATQTYAKTLQKNTSTDIEGLINAVRNLSKDFYDESRPVNYSKLN